MASTTSPGKYDMKLASTFLNALSFIVFLFLDFLDSVLCFLFTKLDEFFEGRASECYCWDRGGGEGLEVSETLHGRRNCFREMGLFGFSRKSQSRKKIDGGSGNGGSVNRWSDCGCQSCVSWLKSVDQKLHVVVKNIPQDSPEDSSGSKPTQNVIFLHGFLASSSVWTETVFQILPESEKCHYRLFAVDLLGFGRSPKPRDSTYTLREHVEMIEKSVIDQFQLDSFHVVAHSMGCIIALALAAKYLRAVKSVTLVAPPYFPAIKNGASMEALKSLAGKRLWPPPAFGSSVLSWYEHIGRCICFLFCRNHRIWESIMKLFTQKRDLHFVIVDLTRHTHHSAWHSMHNVVYGGAKLTDGYLEALIKAGVKVYVVHGDQDPVVPLECSNNLKAKFQDVELNIIGNADHGSVILGREREFAEILEHVWISSSNLHSSEPGDE